MRGRELAGRSQSGAGTFLIGVACGAAVGGALALLFAPKSGAQFRAALRGSADEIAEDVHEAHEDTLATIGELVETGRTAMHEGQDSVRRAARAAVDAAKSSARL
jgi:gas vesicle protein